MPSLAISTVHPGPSALERGPTDKEKGSGQVGKLCPPGMACEGWEEGGEEAGWEGLHSSPPPCPINAAIKSITCTKVADNHLITCHSLRSFHPKISKHVINN